MPSGGCAPPTTEGRGHETPDDAGGQDCGRARGPGTGCTAALKAPPRGPGTGCTGPTGSAFSVLLAAPHGEKATWLLIASKASLASPWVALTWPYQIEPPKLD